MMNIFKLVGLVTATLLSLLLMLYSLFFSGLSDTEAGAGNVSTGDRILMVIFALTTIVLVYFTYKLIRKLLRKNS